MNLFSLKSLKPYRIILIIVVVFVVLKKVLAKLTMRPLPMPKFAQFVQEPRPLQNEMPLQVVEAFATWCGPCKAAIPHMNALYVDNPDVYFVGVSNEDQNEVDAFMKKCPIAYNVSLGDQAEKLMRQTLVPGIPHAFLFLYKTLVWHGHPSGLGKQIKKYKQILENGKNQ